MRGTWIFLLLIFALTGPVCIAQAGTSTDLETRLELAARAWHDAGLFDGVILVGRGGDIAWQGGFGDAVREWEIANAPDVRYPIASLTKQFTAVLIMQAMQEELLELDQTLGELLPWYTGEARNRVTVRDLLSHTSGIPDTPVVLYTNPSPEAEDARWVAENHCSGALQFDPGTGFDYTNTDYHLLGAVLEAVHGQRFEEIVRARIVEPLALSDTRLARRDEVWARRPVDYVPAENGWLRAIPFEWENWGAAGGLYSTVTDLHRWNQALSRHELLSAETTELMLTPRETISGTGSYVALGSWVYSRPLPGSDLAPLLVERRGAIGGFASLNVFEKDSEDWVILLTNHYNENIHSLPWARCLPLDLWMVLKGLSPQGPEPSEGR